MARLDHPLRATDIAQEVGVSLRSLQKAFRTVRGQSLTQFLRAGRLEMARKRLLAGLPGTTVSIVALDCGFAHFGKFAAYYRARFGETPSETLRQGLAR
jgi:transcriptional regulator GlxA family with amidase domain